MRLSLLIESVREQASVITANRWTDPRIAAILNEQQRSLVREAAITGHRWFNYRLALAATVARQQSADLFTYRMPSWVMKVAEVRLGSTTPTTSMRGPIIPRLTQTRRRLGWQLGATGELELYGQSSGLDLDIDVAKLPARMTRGTLPAPSGVATNQLRLDADDSADAVDYPHESELNAYAGSLFEITGPASTRKGQLLRCTASLPNQGGSSKETVLTMEEAWATPPIVSDTYEMRAEIPTEHCRLLVLVACRTLFASEKNMQGIAAIAGELNEQWSLYTKHIASRDLAGPHLVVTSLDGGDSGYYGFE